MSDRLGDSCGLRMSSNSLELLLKIGIFDFLSPCLIGLGFVSGDMNLANNLGGFIRETLGVLCSCAVSSCSLPERSPFLLNFPASGNDICSSDLLIVFSRFVRSLIDVFFSVVSSTFAQYSVSSILLQSFAFKESSREFSSFDNVLSSKPESSNGSR